MTRLPRRRGVLPIAIAVLCIWVTAPADAQGSSLTFGTCSSTQVVAHAPGVQCATLKVPFDRADPAVGDIALAVQRVPPSAPRTGVLLLLAGGPGQPALPAFEELLAPLAREPALRGFELVAFDQRGTGQSEGLQCVGTPPEKDNLSEALGVCGDALGATRGFYTSQESVEDLESLRQGLGGTPLSLFAVSYGTRVAGMYAREHPQGTARMVLDSPEPPNGHGGLDSQRLRALPRVLDLGVCGAGACRSFSRDPYADLTHLVAALHRHPMRTRIYDDKGRLRPARVTETGVLRLLSGFDLSQGARELAPAAIAAAAHGDAAPLARLTHTLQAESPGSILASTGTETAPGTAGLLDPLGEAASQAPEGDSAISLALFAATYCDENELPWSSNSAPAGRAAVLHSWLASLPASTSAPFSPATAAASSGLSYCADWPATPPAPPSPTGLSATPTLILSGVDDLRTPYEQALTVAAGYTDAQLLRVPGVGHSTESTDRTGCARRAMIEFISSGMALTSCRNPSEAQALPLPPQSLDQVPAAASDSRAPGRVAAAAAMTLEDLFGQTSPSGGGLRGGSWAIVANGFALHAMVDVPGVLLSGNIGIGTGSSLLALSGHLTVRGRLDGRLTLRGITLTGRVAGAPVHARLAAL